MWPLVGARGRRVRASASAARTGCTCTQKGEPARQLAEQLPGLLRSSSCDKWRIDELYDATVVGAVDALADISVVGRQVDRRRHPRAAHRRSSSRSPAPCCARCRPVASRPTPRSMVVGARRPRLVLRSRRTPTPRSARPRDRRLQRHARRRASATRTAGTRTATASSTSRGLRRARARSRSTSTPTQTRTRAPRGEERLRPRSPRRELDARRGRKPDKSGRTTASAARRRSTRPKPRRRASAAGRTAPQLPPAVRAMPPAVRGSEDADEPASRSVVFELVPYVAGVRRRRADPAPAGLARARRRSALVGGARRSLLVRALWPGAERRPRRRRARASGRTCSTVIVFLPLVGAVAVLFMPRQIAGAAPRASRSACWRRLRRVARSCCACR